MNTKTAQKLSVILQQNVINDKEREIIHQIGHIKSENDQKEETYKVRADGHSVTFLQKDGLFENTAPKLLNKLLNTMKETDAENWKLIDNEIQDKQNVNYRVIEYHHYVKGGGLLNKNHFDGGSILTAVIMLSDPTKDFEGGQLMTWECDETYKIYDDIRQNDMIIFPSHKYHSVSTVTKGERYVLVIELWEGDKGTDDHRTGGFSHLLPPFGANNIF